MSEPGRERGGWRGGGGTSCLLRADGAGVLRARFDADVFLGPAPPMVFGNTHVAGRATRGLRVVLRIGKGFQFKNFLAMKFTLRML